MLVKENKMKNLFNDLVEKKEKLALVGLGYVGMPIAVAFSKKVDVIGFDVNRNKIEAYKNGVDPTNEVGNEAIKECAVEFTCDEERLKEVKFFIVVKIVIKWMTRNIDSYNVFFKFEQRFFVVFFYVWVVKRIEVLLSSVKRIKHTKLTRLFRLIVLNCSVNCY